MFHTSRSIMSHNLRLHLQPYEFVDGIGRCIGPKTHNIPSIPEKNRKKEHACAWNKTSLTCFVWFCCFHLMFSTSVNQTTHVTLVHLSIPSICQLHTKWRQPSQLLITEPTPSLLHHMFSHFSWTFGYSSNKGINKCNVPSCNDVQT